MDSKSDQSVERGLEKPPTLVAQSASLGRAKAIGTDIQSIAMATIAEDKSAKMPVLQPNVNIVGTRTKSGRIQKPARNFSSDEYVVPTLIKRRIPANSRASENRTKPVPTPPPIVPVVSAPPAQDLEVLRLQLEKKFPKSTSDEDDAPFGSIMDVCFKEHEKHQNMSVLEIHTKVKDCHKNWIKGPYKLRDDEIKFVQECIVKPEWSRISVRDWRLLAEALKDRMFRMRKRFTKAGRISKGRQKPDVKKPVTTRQKTKEAQDSDDDLVGSDVDYEPVEDESDEAEQDNSSTHSSRLSTRSKDPAVNKTIGDSSKTSSVTNDAELDVSLGSVGGIDDFSGAEIKDEPMDENESTLSNEGKDKVSGSSMVEALHATLEKDGGPEYDPSQYEPPALEKDGIFALEDMDSNSCNFFENVEEPGFGNAETPTGLTEEAFAELDQDQETDQKMDDEVSSADNDDSSTPPMRVKRMSLCDNMDKVDLENVEIEESSGNVKNPHGAMSEAANLGATMISTKTALMCALKISEDFLPSSHEKYLDRLEESEKYQHEELDDIRKKFNLKPSSLTGKRKLIVEDAASKKAKVALKPINGNEKPRPHPYLRSAYAKCRKFMEDETTVIEKLGNNKILAAGRVIDINYEKYTKESEVELPYDDLSAPMPALPPPSASNCHAPSCRLGCICSSISEDMPPRKHCGRPRCFFECTCQNILFNSADDGDIRSRLRPRVSLLNWRAESTEKEKEPMTSYRQMERGTSFIRVRRVQTQPERLRREFVLDGKVVDKSASKVSKERRTKALLQKSHHRMMAKPAEGSRFMRIVPPKSDQEAKVDIEQLKKKCCTPMTIQVEHMNLDVEIVEVDASGKPKTKPSPKREVPALRPMSPPRNGTRLTGKDYEEMKSIIQEMTEDCQLIAIDQGFAFFSWTKGTIHPKVTMYQARQGDIFQIPWLYLPIPPVGYSWICHQLNQFFENSEYLYIPEIKCSISTNALRVNMNRAFMNKKGVTFDVKSADPSKGCGRIYFFPNLPKVLVCGPFKTDQTTLHPKDLSCADNVANAVEHIEKIRALQPFGADQSWNRFTSRPVIYPIKNRSDNVYDLPRKESQELFANIFSNGSAKAVQKPLTSVPALHPPKTLRSVPPPKPVFASWSSAVKFVGLGCSNPATSTTSHESRSLTEMITMNL